jgi:aerobic carbon-monoxide dehydrogenase medium subunit
VRPFELVEPSSLAEAVRLLDADDPTVRPIAGGTALMLMMKARLFQPTRLVSLRQADGAVRGIHVDESGAIRIGAMAPLSELEYSPLVAITVPVVSRALRTL